MHVLFLKKGILFLKEKRKLSCYTDNIKYGDRMLPACGKAMSGSRKSDRKVRIRFYEEKSFEYFTGSIDDDRSVCLRRR